VTAAVRSQRARALAAVVLTATLLQGCGGGDEPATSGASVTEAPPASKPASGDALITIRNFAYVPKTLTVQAGQKITVVNVDRAPHTITAGDGTFDSGELAQDQSASFSVSEPGEHTYICDLHQYMTGQIIVR